MIVVYDATGIRRQAGMQAQKINILVEELLKGHPISEEHLREVLGHTPLEAMGGVLLGLVWRSAVVGVDELPCLAKAGSLFQQTPFASIEINC